MPSWNYRTVFKAVAATDSLPVYIRHLAAVITEKGFDKKAVRETLLSDGITTLHSIKDDLMDLLLAYLNLILDDHHISEDEYKEAQLLKLLFQIHEGEFHRKRYAQVRSVVSRQLNYLSEDDLNFPDKAVFTVHLQDLFDLGYDAFHTLLQDIREISPQNRNAFPLRTEIDLTKRGENRPL